MKIGDRVRITNGFGRLVQGYTGTIINIINRDDIDVIGVEFDKHIKGHNCNGRGKDGYCYNIPLDRLEIIDEFKEVSIKWYKNGELI